MDLQNLKEHHEELLSFMENNGYSSTYIRRFREEINRILAKADSHDWQSYRDVYLDYLKAPHSKDYTGHQQQERNHYKKNVCPCVFQASLQQWDPYK